MVNTDTAWIKIVSEKTEYYPKNLYRLSDKPKKTDGYKLVLWKFDCASKKLGIIQSSVYNKDGEIIDSYKKNEILVEMDYVNPDSIGEALLGIFCGLK
jgi:hypothetical protein